MDGAGLDMRAVQRSLYSRMVLFLVVVLSVLWGGQEVFAQGCPTPPREVQLGLYYKTTRKTFPMTYKTKNTRGGVILLAMGSIKPGESARLANAIQRVGPRLAEIWLYSPGGTSVEGIKMGRLIRKKGLATRIPKGAMCFSACSMVFLGGVLRTVDAGGYYGVHMWT